MGTAAQNNENAPIAFVLVICAGLSTGIGAGFVFNKRLVKLASKRFLAGSLGLAAGVMLYVSLVEIFVKSQIAFSNHGYNERDAYGLATLSLFGGILFYKGIDFVVHRLEGGGVGDHNVDIDLYDLDGSVSSGASSPRVAVAEAGAGVAKKAKGEGRQPVDGMAPSSSSPFSSAEVAPSGIFRDTDAHHRDLHHYHHQQQHHRRRSSHEKLFPHGHDVVVEISSGRPTVQPSPDLHTLQLSMAGKIQTPQQQMQQQCSSCPASAMMTPPIEYDDNDDDSKAVASSGDGGGGGGSSAERAMEEGGEAGHGGGGGGGEGAAESVARAGGDDQGAGEAAVSAGDNEKLVRMGLMTAVAIGIHNFPEGLATFVAALSDPSVGLALAVAIAIHNIPEGLCVAIPVYYATGNRWKAFGWALLSGVSEPIGAGLGWLILKDVMSELVYGVLFGVVAGMMMNITIHELIPTAVRYDPADKVTTNSIIVGMAIMALSLTLFLY
ncbi:unnamed protein product [Pylaiella littoralis]